jgi:hypothetical protein
MRKLFTTPVMLVLLSVLSFSSLFALHTFTEPILINRENQLFLTILDTPTFAGVTIESPQQATSPYVQDGVVRYQRFLKDDVLLGIIYTIDTTGYNSGLQFTLGIRDDAFRTLIVDNTNETPNYGGTYLNLLPSLVQGVSIADEATFIALFLAQTTGRTETSGAVIKALIASSRHYKAETN